jgi:hypothetical protein
VWFGCALVGGSSDCWAAVASDVFGSAVDVAVVVVVAEVPGLAWCDGFVASPADAVSSGDCGFECVAELFVCFVVAAGLAAGAQGYRLMTVKMAMSPTSMARTISNTVNWDS